MNYNIILMNNYIIILFSQLCRSSQIDNTVALAYTCTCMGRTTSVGHCMYITVGTTIVQVIINCSSGIEAGPI